MTAKKPKLSIVSINHYTRLVYRSALFLWLLADYIFFCLFKNEDLSLSLFAMANFGHKDVTVEDIQDMISENPMLAMKLSTPETAKQIIPQYRYPLVILIPLNYPRYTMTFILRGPMQT